MINRVPVCKVYQLFVGAMMLEGYCGSIEWVCLPWGGSEGLVLVHEQLCFFRSDFKMEWDEAESYCKKHGGILAKETNKQISSFFRHELLGSSDISATVCFWIGLNDKGDANNWRWSDGEEAVYTNWNSFKTLTGWLEGHFLDCVCTSKAGWNADGFANWKWSAGRCGGDRRFLCQFDAIPVEELTTAPTPDSTVEPVKIESKIPRNTRRKTAMQVIQLTTEKGCRLIATPEWTIKSFTVTACARRCQDSGVNCQLFNYNRMTWQCNAFSTESVMEEGRIVEKGWTLWKMSVTVVY